MFVAGPGTDETCLAHGCVSHHHTFHQLLMGLFIIHYHEPLSRKHPEATKTTNITVKGMISNLLRKITKFDMNVMQLEVTPPLFISYHKKKNGDNTCFHCEKYTKYRS